jgi:hypothetical protein
MVNTLHRASEYSFQVWWVPFTEYLYQTWRVPFTRLVSIHTSHGEWPSHSQGMLCQTCWVANMELRNVNGFYIYVWIVKCSRRTNCSMKFICSLKIIVPEDNSLESCTSDLILCVRHTSDTSIILLFTYFLLYVFNTDILAHAVQFPVQ